MATEMLQQKRRTFVEGKRAVLENAFSATNFVASWRFRVGKYRHSTFGHLS